MLYTVRVLSMHLARVNSFIFHNMFEKQVLLFLHQFAGKETEARKGKKFAVVMQPAEWQQQDLNEGSVAPESLCHLGLPMKTTRLPMGK